MVAGSGSGVDGGDGGVLTDAVAYDPSTNTVHYDAATLQDVHDSIGDFAGGLLLAAAWSSAVQHQLGVEIGTDAARRGAECLAGAWAADTRVVAVAGRPRRGRDRAGVGRAGRHDRGTAFERVAAFRAGFKHGPADCVQSS